MTMKRTVTFLLVALLLGTMAAALCVFSRKPRLPFDGLEALRRGSWQSFGGLWIVQDGVIFNRSDELGAKLMAGSPEWSNYRLSADVRMLRHHGAAGVIVRANNVGIGINEYRGYYIGFRSMDKSLTVGFSDRDWIEARPVPIMAHLQLDDWLHINVVAVGCDIAAELTVLRTGESVRRTLHQDSCVTTGEVGLRSLGSGAAWKNIEVVHANHGDLARIQKSAPVAERPVYPKREDDLVTMLAQQLSTPERFFADFDNDGDNRRELSILASARPIASLNKSLQEHAAAILQGAVTHVDPLYIQDSSGGIAVHSDATGILNLGDELEVSGKMIRTEAERYFDATSIRLLWDDAPQRPVAITSDQAASGLFEGSLVELSGRLISRSTRRDGTLQLRMASGAEEFSVIAQQSLAQRAMAHWEAGSTLRVRGVCSSDHQDLPATDLFRILSRSDADILLISPPPWTSGTRLAFLVSVALALLGGSVFAYIRIERWKMRTIYEERERLAADMHDTLAQGFAGVGYQLQSLRKGLREDAKVPTHLMRRLDTACELATETHREASTRITALHFAAGEQYDVIEILQRSITLMLGSDSALVVLLERAGSPRNLSLANRDALFRIGHEAIANALRHSHATRIILRLDFAKSGALLEIADNGAGFQDPSRHGFGLDSMRARAIACGGTVEICTQEGEGTTVRVKLPYEADRRFWRRLGDGVFRNFRTSETSGVRRPG